MHEEMITVSDTYNTYDLGKYFAICNPSINNLLKGIQNIKKYFQENHIIAHKINFLLKKN